MEIGKLVLSLGLCDMRRGNSFKQKEGRFKLDKEDIFYCEGDETLEQVAQRERW